MAGRLYREDDKVLYKGKILCGCFDTNLCDRFESAEMIAALFNRWLDKLEAIEEEITQSAGTMINSNTLYEGMGEVGLHKGDLHEGTTERTRD